MVLTSGERKGWERRPLRLWNAGHGLLGNTHLVAWTFAFYLLIKLHNCFILFLYIHHIFQCPTLTNTVGVRGSKARVKEALNILSCSA